jgi:hypothetical protein
MAQQYSDTLLLDFLEKRECIVKLNDDGEWSVEAEAYNPSFVGEGETLRQAIINCIAQNEAC